MISGPAYGAVDERWEQLEMDIEAINEMFEGLGPVTVKRMFGGQGSGFHPVGSRRQESARQNALLVHS